MDDPTIYSPKQVIDYRMILKDITKSGNRKSKIARLESLKADLNQSLFQQQKARQFHKLLSDKNKLQLSLTRQSPLSSRAAQDEQVTISCYTKEVVRQICRCYDNRDRINQNLFQVQNLFKKCSLKYSQCCDREGQQKFLTNLRRVNKTANIVLNDFRRVMIKVKAQLSNLQDFLRALKTKHWLLKNQAVSKAKTTVIADELNENANQLLVNL